jgi:hypothetical protein
MGSALSTSSGFLVAFLLPFFLYTGVSSFLSSVFSIPLIFFLCIGISGMDCSSITSLGIDDLVKGLLPLISTIGGEEEKSSFFPFLYVALVE